MKFYTDGTEIAGTENDPDEQTELVNPATEPEVEPEVPAFVLEMSRANQATRNAQAESDRLRAEIEALRNPPPPPITLEEGDAFNKPGKLLDAFSKMLEAQVGPLKKDVAESQRARVYADMKNQIRASNPAFAKIEHLVDKLMIGQEVTEGNIISCVERAVGQMLLSNPAAFTANRPVNSEAPPTKDMRPPPHLASKPGKPAEVKKNDARFDLSNFNENEKRLMREKNLTPKQFVLLRDTDPNSMTREYYKQIMEDKS